MAPKKTRNYLTKEEEAHFEGLLHNARMEALGTDEIPEISVDRKTLEHYNRGHMAGVDSAGYYIHGGVKVYDEARILEAKKKEALTSEEVVFGRSKAPIDGDLVTPVNHGK